MTPDPAREIYYHNQRRHSHHDPIDLEHCRNCGSFVNKGDPDGAGRIRYQCPACGHALLEYARKSKEHASP